MPERAGSYLCGPMRIATLFLLLFLATTFACSRFQRVQKRGTLEEKYQAALKYYEKKDYLRAGMLFEEIIPLLQGSEKAEKAQFYFAHSHFHQKQYTLAAFYFKRFADTFARSPLVEEAAYMYVNSLYEDTPDYNLDQSNTLSTVEAAQTFLNTYSQSTYAPKVIEILNGLRVRLELKAYDNAKLYYRINNYKAAVIAITNFARDFPDSKFNEELAYLRLISQVRYARESLESGKALQAFKGFMSAN